VTAPVLGAAGALLVIISGPSGVGKDTIIAAMRRLPGAAAYHYVVTCTTRAPRPGEVDGIDYRFLTPEAFARMREAAGFLECAEVHGNWYGTPRDSVRAALAAGRHVVLKIDVQGAATVKREVPDALLIFLMPPSTEELFSRLRARGTESAHELEVRQRNAMDELARRDDYDHVVENRTGEIDRTAAAIVRIIDDEQRAHADRRLRV
jgi:guanylate kinase